MKGYAIFLLESMGPIMHEQNIICSKTHLNGITQEQTIICWQLFAGHVVGSRPMERKKTMRQMIIVFLKKDIEDITWWREDMNFMLSGKNNISRVTAANSWDIVLATRTFRADFREDFRRFSKIVQKARQTFPNIFREFPKNYEDVRRFPKIAKDLRGRDLKMFRWYTNEVKYNLRDKLDIREMIIIFPCEDIVWFLSICYHSVFHWLLYNKSD